VSLTTKKPQEVSKPGSVTLVNLRQQGWSPFILRPQASDFSPIRRTASVASSHRWLQRVGLSVSDSLVSATLRFCKLSTCLYNRMRVKL